MIKRHSLILLVLTAASHSGAVKHTHLWMFHLILLFIVINYTTINLHTAVSRTVGNVTDLEACKSACYKFHEFWQKIGNSWLKDKEHYYYGAANSTRNGIFALIPLSFGPMFMEALCWSSSRHYTHRRFTQALRNLLLMLIYPITINIEFLFMYISDSVFFICYFCVYICVYMYVCTYGG